MWKGLKTKSTIAFSKSFGILIRILKLSHSSAFVLQSAREIISTNHKIADLLKIESCFVSGWNSSYKRSKISVALVKWRPKARWFLLNSYDQSHYIEIAQGTIFMEQNMRFGLILGQLAKLKKNWAIKYANFEDGLFKFSWAKK